MGANQNMVNTLSVSVDPLSQRDHKRVAKFVEKTAGIQLPDSKRTLIEGRLRKRQRKTQFNSLRDYLDFVFDTPEGVAEQVHLIDAITTNKTDFYREATHFEFLREHIIRVLSPMRQQGWKRPLKIWSAGCSSGEEPYTLAIEMLELQRELPGFQFHIDATDISLSCLEKAQRAIYEHDKITPVPMALRKRYLMRGRDKSQGKVMIAPEVKQHVTFRIFNLLTDEYHFDAPYDVIFCRNVMIYFNNSDRHEISRCFAHSLNKDGLLFIGHSETMADKEVGFSQIIPTVYKLGTY